MYRTSRRLFVSSAQASINMAAARSARTPLTRRMMSSESHSGHGSASSDRPWMIGSALVFGPLFLYLVSPSGRKGSHGHTDHDHKNHLGEHKDNHAQHVDSHREERVKPVIDEGTEVSGEVVKESMEKAFEADSPKDAREREDEVATETITAVQSSVTEVQPQAESSADTTLIPVSARNATPAAPVSADAVTNATSDEKVQTTASETGDPAAESKA